MMGWIAEDGRWHLLTHFFVKKNGLIGASGCMDPKKLFDLSDKCDYTQDRSLDSPKIAST